MLVGASLNALRCLTLIAYTLYDEGLKRFPYDFLIPLTIRSLAHFGHLIFAIGLVIHVFQRQQMKARIRDLEQMIDDLHQR